VQYDPEAGRQISAVTLPVKRPTACTFGALQHKDCPFVSAAGALRLMF
jgi:hypothetical protein